MTLEITVESNADENGMPRPTRFTIGSHAYVVSELLDIWPADGYGYVKLRAGDDGIFILRWEQQGTDWSLALYDSGDFDPTRLSGDRPSPPP